uniref:Uncharacterized protein n=1 Tax=Ciona intestinalis TaxID=7719 RepID=F6VYG4_CIOIN
MSKYPDPVLNSQQQYIRVVRIRFYKSYIFVYSQMGWEIRMKGCPIFTNLLYLLIYIIYIYMLFSIRLLVKLPADILRVIHSVIIVRQCSFPIISNYFVI